MEQLVNKAAQFGYDSQGEVTAILYDKSKIKKLDQKLRLFNAQRIAQFAESTNGVDQAL